MGFIVVAHLGVGGLNVSKLDGFPWPRRPYRLIFHLLLAVKANIGTISVALLMGEFLKHCSRR